MLHTAGIRICRHQIILILSRGIEKTLKMLRKQFQGELFDVNRPIVPTANFKPSSHCKN